LYFFELSPLSTNPYIIINILSFFSICFNSICSANLNSAVRTLGESTNILDASLYNDFISSFKSSLAVQWANFLGLDYLFINHNDNHRHDYMWQ